MQECDLAAEMNRYAKGLGANDSFLMLSGGPHQQGVGASSNRPLERGDIIIAESTPAYDGQFGQICRSASVGAPSDVLAEIAPRTRFDTRRRALSDDRIRRLCRERARGCGTARGRETPWPPLSPRGGAHLPEGVVANAIGLSLDEGPGDPLEAGAVYAVTSSATEGGETAYASALVAVREDGSDELWRQTA